jgi:hypothetical protein
MNCRVCGKPEIRQHRHGKGAPIRYGKFLAEQERAWIRTLLRQARARITSA